MGKHYTGELSKSEYKNRSTATKTRYKITDKEPQKDFELDSPFGGIGLVDDHTPSTSTLNNDKSGLGSLGDQYRGYINDSYRIGSSISSRIEEKKLTILLIEESEKVLNNIEKLKRNVDERLENSDVILIYYGEKVYVSGVIDSQQFNFEELFNCGKTIKLYDAIFEVFKIVQEKYLLISNFKDEQGKNKRKKITSVEIIGFGTGVDIGSVLIKEEATILLAALLDDTPIKKFAAHTRMKKKK